MFPVFKVTAPPASIIGADYLPPDDHDLASRILQESYPSSVFALGTNNFAGWLEQQFFETLRDIEALINRVIGHHRFQILPNVSTLP